MKKKILVLYGGISSERDVSIQTGKNVSQAIDKNKYQVSDYEIKKESDWQQKLINHLENKPDLVFICLHGKYGEDGTIQKLLDNLKIKYTGSGAVTSSLAMNKAKCLDFVEKFNIKTPEHYLINSNYSKYKKFAIDSGQARMTLNMNSVGFPCIVKPNSSGSSIGVSIVNKEKELLPAIKIAQKENDEVIIEQFIKGREFTCGILGNTGNNDFLLLPPIEIINKESKFFDFQAKYSSSGLIEICPAKINKELTKNIQNTAKKVHQIINCRGLTRSDFILSEDNQLYFLEINTIPGQTPVSLCPKEAKAFGMTFEQFIEKQIELAYL